VGWQPAQLISRHAIDLVRRRAAWCAAWAAALCLAVGLSVWARAADRLPGDHAVARRAQDLPAWFEPIAEGVRWATRTEAVLAAGGAVAVALLARGRRRAALALAAALLVLPLLQWSVKEAVDRPRPDPALVERRAGFTSPSYPSGHVMSGTFLLGYAAGAAGRTRTAAGRGTAALALVLALVNGVANVYEGVHWPSDVLGGLAWAAVVLGLPAAVLAGEPNAGHGSTGPGRGPPEGPPPTPRVPVRARLTRQSPPENMI
jgi:membrane-associated phospholipid phosphatase